MRIENSPNFSAVSAFAGNASRVAAIFALCVLSAAAHAESCSPATPRLDPGTSFTPFGENEQVLARAGHSGPAWEWALGANTDSGRKVLGSLDWVSGRVYKWKLVNTGTSKEVLTIRNRGKVVLRLAFPSRMDAGNALELRVSTNPSVGPHTTIAASVTKLNGHAVSGSLSQPGTRKHSAQAVYYYFPEMANGFSAEGTVSLTYRHKKPNGTRVQFTVRAGTIPCNVSGNAPTVSIATPVANSTFRAPATVTVTAEAQDSDGRVTQVAFYANGNPIGLVASSPFTIQWSDVQQGSYGLTAVATDDDGLQTTSSVIPIKATAVQALYFVHVDHLATPRLISDEDQKTAWKSDYREPFGNGPSTDDTNSNDVLAEFPLRFPGQYADQETNLIYNYFRYYDASLARYLRADPVGLVPFRQSKRATNLNHLYLYARVDPLRLADPSGLLSPWQHYDITTDGFADTALPRNFASDVAREAAMLDFRDGSQSVEMAYIHAMTPVGGDPFAARAATESFINYQVRLCTPQGLGWALHAAQDMYAHGHAGQGEYGGLVSIEMVFHTFDDWFPSKEDRAAALEETKRLIRLYQRLCEQECE